MAEQSFPWLREFIAGLTELAARDDLDRDERLDRIDELSRATERPQYARRRVLTARYRLTPPPAGAWIREWHTDHWTTSRWHLFEGDLGWREKWAYGANIETACGYNTGTIDPEGDHLRLTDDPGDLACRLCLRRRDASPIELPRSREPAA